MKIIVVSDSHGKEGILDELVHKYPEADAFIHCGDIEEEAYDHEEYIIVKGNNDVFYDYPESHILTALHHRIYITHSHLFSYMRRMEQMSEVAKENHCDIVCFGHTHVAVDETVNNVRLINPGSLWRSRDGRGPSYAILTIDKDSVDVEFIFLPQKKSKFFW